MTDMLKVALSVVRGLGLPAFPCRETLDEKGKVRKIPIQKMGTKLLQKTKSRFACGGENSQTL